MSTLTGNKISLTYKSLIKTADNDVLTAVLKELSDGLGNNSGVFLNTGGDLKSTGILEFANFKGTSTSVTINKLVNEADGISNNDNDTSLATSAAVKDYVDTHVTTQDLDFSDGTNPGAVDLDSQVFAIVGTSNEIETSASGQQLQIGLPNDVTISGTFFATEFQGALAGTINSGTTATTQTAGDNSTKVATTAYVDTLDAASDLDFSDGTTNSAVNLNTQVFSVEGTSNEITTTASGQSLTVSLDSTGVNLPDNSTAITQTAGDNSTKVATTAYVDVLDSASDLDIAGDTGTGDVNLNTQTFTLSGTTNQVITSVSGQEATFSLPSTVHRNLQGNVTGDLTGNADTATAWETARDLILSSEATGTISNVDGTQNVTGAVTLLNSAVTGKVLTGLPTPAAGNIQSSDTILEAFGKLQSQVSSISNGLIFKGSWDAATNTPTLTSGGGEVDSGTTTGQTAFKLIETGQNFNTTVTIGDKVINQVDGTTALVTVIDSNTQLTLDADIMLSGEAYTIDASPFIPQGNYYVVNYAGTTNLNGITDWSIGDWVIADADNRWSKLDHSQVDGQGTPGHLPVFATATTIGDSIVAQSGTALTVTGSLSTTLGASVTGDFAVNTDKFTVAAASGNTAFTGDLAINTNKFTIQATSGNTVVGGTLNVIGTSTLANVGYLGDGLGSVQYTFQSANNGFATIDFGDVADSNIGRLSYSHVDNSFSIRTNNATALTLDSSQNSTFAGNVTANVGTFNSDSGGTGLKIIGRSAANSGTLRYYQNNGTTQTARIESNDSIFEINSISNLPIELKTNDTLALTLDASQNATFSGRVGVGGLSTSKFTIEHTGAAPPSTTYATTEANASVHLSAVGIPIYNHLFMGIGSATYAWIQVQHGNSAMQHLALNPLGGNVGIGTTSPQQKLDVIGRVRASYDTSNYYEIGATSSGGFVVGKSGGVETVNIRTYGNSHFTGGNVGIGTNSPGNYRLNVSKGAVGDVAQITDGVANTFVIRTDANTLYTGNANNLPIAFVTNNTERMRISASGNVGIGVSTVNNPFTAQAALQVGDTSTATNNGLITIGSGTTGSGDIYFADGTSGGSQYKGFVSYKHNGDYLAFGTAETTRMIIDSSGSLIVGTATVAAANAAADNIVIKGTGASVGLTISQDSNSGTGTIFFGDAASSAAGGFRYNHNTGDMAVSFEDDITFANNGGERMRITSGGRVGIGGSPQALLDVVKTSSTIYDPTDDLGQRSGTATIHITNQDTATNSFGQIMYDTDGSGQAVARIVFLDRGAASSGIAFVTENSETKAERMRIESTGNLLVGATANTEVSNLTLGHLLEASSSSVGLGAVGTYNRTGTANCPSLVVLNRDASTDSSNVFVRFYANVTDTGATSMGGIVGNGANNVQFAALSDIREKENVKTIKSSLDKISKLNPVEFDWKKTGEHIKAGFIAQEVEEIFPEYVVENTSKEGEEERKGLTGGMTSGIVAHLVKSIQELKAEVDKLKQECKCK